MSRARLLSLQMMMNCWHFQAHALPSRSCDNHFRAQFIEFIPEILRFDDHFDVRQFRVQGFARV